MYFLPNLFAVGQTLFAKKGFSSCFRKKCLAKIFGKNVWQKYLAKIFE